MESFGLGKKPVKPTSLEIQFSKLFESTLLVYLWVVGELGTLDETEDDRIFEPNQDGANPIEGEGVSGESIIGLHDWLPGEGERVVGGGICARTGTYTHSLFEMIRSVWGPAT